MAAACLDSSRISLQDRSSCSRGVFARVPINNGDVILSEQPLVASQLSWNQQYNYTACNHCMKSLETAQNMGRRLAANYEISLPHLTSCCMSTQQQSLIHKCLGCDVQFCSEECEVDANEKYHKFMCNNSQQINDLQDMWREMHYPPEKTTVMLLVRIVAMIVQSTDDSSLTSTLNHFMLNDEKVEETILQELLGEEYKEKLNELYSCLKTCLPVERYNKLSTCNDFTSLLASVVRNGQVIGTSSLSEYVHNIDALQLSDVERHTCDETIDQMYDQIEKESGDFINCEGIGLFALQSRCSHSCSPNAEVSFPHNDHTLVLTALHPIQQGEEILVSFLEDCQLLRGRATRKRLLWKNFAYVCSCARCETGDSDSAASDTSNEEMDDDDYSDCSQ